MKIYIAGKITGLQFSHVKVKFDHAERWLKTLHYNPVNPVNLFPDAKNVEWDQAMAVCLQVLKNCDAIYLLPDWSDSRGAREEVKYALSLNMPIFNEHNIINHA
jgi:hypothetical protein